MSQVQPVPPLIPASVVYDTETTIFKESENVIIQNNIYCNNITIESTSNQIIGIQNPINNTDAVPLQYMNNIYPGPPIQSVQYNSNGAFAGSSALFFTGSYNNGTLITSNLVSGNIYISGVSNIIVGLSNPTNSTDIATKGYVDNLLQYNITNITTSNTTLSAASMVNGIILIGSTENNISIATNNTYNNQSTTNSIYITNSSISTTFGTFSTASLTEFNTFSNGLYNCTIQNLSDFNIYINPGLNVIMNSMTIPGYYTAYMNILLTSGAASIASKSINPTVTYLSNVLNSQGITTNVPYFVENNILIPFTDTNISIVNYTYTSNDIYSGYIVRTPASNSLDILNISGSNNIYIKNSSTNIITINSNTNNYIINPGQTIFLSIDVLTYNELGLF